MKALLSLALLLTLAILVLIARDGAQESNAIDAGSVPAPPPRDSRQDFTELSDKERLPCADGSVPPDRHMVALAFGQSNAANHGFGHHVARREVVNFFEGHCYRAVDPLLGATFTRAAVWGRVGDRLVESGRYDRVTWVTIGVGGTRMEQWAPPGELFARIGTAVREARAAGLEFTHLLWHQGESDANQGTSGARYIERMHAMVDGIRDLGVTAPLYAAVATVCKAPPDEEIRAAQRAVIAARPDVHPGPDTDALLGPALRHRECHFTDAGLERHADLWVDALSGTDADEDSRASTTDTGGDPQ